MNNSMIESKCMYFKSLENSRDITSRILLTHVFLEYLLERYISTKAKKTKRLFGKNGLSFVHKLNVAESFDEFSPQIFDAVRKINELRNGVAHEFQYQLEETSIEDLARTTGKNYKEMKSNSKDTIELFDRSLVYIVGRISGFVDQAENSRDTVDT